MLLYILLKFIIALCCRCFFTKLKVFDTVIADNAAPKRIIHIKCKDFFVFSVNGFYYCRKIICKIRHRLTAHCILEHIPICQIGPPVKSEGRCKITYIVDIKTDVRICVFRKTFIKAIYIAYRTSVIIAITVAEQAVKRRFEIVLDNRASETLVQLRPYRFKVCKLPFKKRIDSFL